MFDSHDFRRTKLDRAVDEPIELTEREIAIARRAAEMAIAQLSDEFYKQVGKTFIQKFVIALGLFVVGFGIARGWIKFGG